MSVSRGTAVRLSTTRCASCGVPIVTFSLSPLGEGHPVLAGGLPSAGSRSDADEWGLLVCEDAKRHLPELLFMAGILKTLWVSSENLLYSSVAC